MIKSYLPEAEHRKLFEFLHLAHSAGGIMVQTSLATRLSFTLVIRTAAILAKIAIIGVSVIMASASISVNPLCAQRQRRPQPDPPDRLWHIETQYPANGYIVKERLQNPLFGITAGIIPGAMPVVIHLQIDGTVKTKANTNYTWGPEVQYEDGRPPYGGAWRQYHKEHTR
jgi:hypothetical protein